MSIIPRDRNIIIAVAAALIIVAVLAFLLGRGCGGEEKAATSTTVATTTATAKTATQTTKTTATATVETTPAAPPAATTPAPAPAPAPAEPLEIISRSVTPEVVDPGHPLTFTVQVRGTALGVLVQAFHRTSGAVGVDTHLTAAGSAGGVTTWSVTTTAPSTQGEYRYFAYAEATDGHVVEMPGVSGWTFCVGNPSVDCS